MYLKTNIQRKVGLKQNRRNFFFFILRDFCCCFGLNVPTSKESAPEFGVGARGFCTRTTWQICSVCRGNFMAIKKKIFFPWVIVNYTNQIILLSLLLLLLLSESALGLFVCLFLTVSSSKGVFPYYITLFFCFALLCFDE